MVLISDSLLQPSKCNFFIWKTPTDKTFASSFSHWFVCVSFSLGSICKYWIFADENIPSLNSSKKAALSQPSSCSFAIKNLKKFHTAFQKFINKISKKKSTRLHDEFFGLKIFHKSVFVKIGYLNFFQVL